MINTNKSYFTTTPLCWFQDRASPLNNTSPVYNQPDGHGFVEATQQYTFEPRPELDGQYLYCVYQQVPKINISISHFAL